MKKSENKCIKISSYGYTLIDKALIVVLSMYNSDSEELDYLKSRFAYLFDFIDKDPTRAVDLCVKIHENR